MIASLRGTVIAIGLSDAVIECGGVGYQFLATPQTLATLVKGEEGFVHTTFVVREDAQTLYGFADTESKEMFSVLQKVSGLGPRLAIAAQSVYSSAELAQAISGGDAKALQKIPGIGKRVAERIIVELKEKVDFFLDDSLGTSAPAVVGNHHSDEVVAALAGLGFPEKVALPAVQAVLAENPDLSVPALLRASLRHLGK